MVSVVTGWSTIFPVQKIPFKADKSDFTSDRMYHTEFYMIFL